MVKDSKNFPKNIKINLKYLDKTNLIKSIKDYEKIEEKFIILKVILFLHLYTDQLNKDKNKFYQSTESISNVEKNLIFFYHRNQ